MKISRIGSRLAAVVAGMMLVGSAAWANVAGIVTAVGPREITVSEVAYKIEDGTGIEDLASHKIFLSEIHPGTSVELEFDDEGHLVTIRAAVVR